MNQSNSKNAKAAKISQFIYFSCIICIFSLTRITILVVFSVVTIFLQYILLRRNRAYITELENKIKELDTTEKHKELENLQTQIAELGKSLEAAQTEVVKAQERVVAANENADTEIAKKKEQLKKEAAKVSKFREMYKSIKYAIDNFFLYDVSPQALKFNPDDMKQVDKLVPSVMLHLQNMNSKELRKTFTANDKQITKVMETYSSRYTTKTNKAIYSLMVIALRAELQNVLAELKYGKLDKSIEDVKNITAKYLTIAGEGNQTIVVTLTKFIGQLEYLFINAVKIEYNYYIKKEKEKQEQIALREKMRQETAERKALEAERKKIENEERKYETEIQKLKEQMENAAKEDTDALNKRILELQEQLSAIVVKKEDIVNLQNGKAGTVYVISNLGSFGDDVFKIGMTRRLEPQERINELGSASVPFKFDVHSFIFSDDAVALENKIHKMLDKNRINKVNSRKEFFKISIDDLEKLVEDIEPTAEFNRTMLANEYRASLEAMESYTEDYFIEESTLLTE